MGGCWCAVAGFSVLAVCVLADTFWLVVAIAGKIFCIYYIIK